MVEETDIAACPRCSGEARIELSSGGATIYYRVECSTCGFNSRGPGHLRGLSPLFGAAYSDNVPQNSRAEALSRWADICDVRPQEPASGET